MTVLLSASTVAEYPPDIVGRHSRVLVTFDRTQDSGNVSWLVEADDRQLFVKSAGPVGPPPPGAAPAPYFDQADRVRLLRNAVELARSCDHPALPRLLNVIESQAEHCGVGEERGPPSGRSERGWVWREPEHARADGCEERTARRTKRRAQLGSPSTSTTAA